jgi:beta-glucosidase
VVVASGHDPVASISQPVRRLRGFERVTLNAFVFEPGTIDVYAGDSSVGGLTDSFPVTP